MLVASRERELRILAVERHAERYEPGDRIDDDHDGGVVFEHGRLGQFFRCGSGSVLVFLWDFLPAKTIARIPVCGVCVSGGFGMRRE